MAKAYDSQPKSPTAEWIIEQRKMSDGNLYALRNFGIAQVKNAEAGYYKTSRQFGSIYNPTNFKLGTMGSYGCYNPINDKLDSCSESQLDTYNVGRNQQSNTIIPTPGKQGFDVKWNNCGLYRAVE
jgi:hypothetical protein